MYALNESDDLPRMIHMYNFRDKSCRIDSFHCHQFSSPKKRIMKNIVFGVVCSLSTLPSSFAQQQFNNGGFENYIDCPTGWDETNKIVGCIGRNDTPDYYNCNYNPSSANNGTGSVYLGAIRDASNNQDVTEGITLELTTPLTSGETYTVDISTNYGVSVYGDPNFDYTQIRQCYNLKFVFAMGNVTGDPAIPHYEIDAEAVVGNQNSDYADFSFSFLADQNYTHVYIVTGSTSTNTSSNPNPDCASAGATAYVYYNIIDDLSITPEEGSSAGIEENVASNYRIYPNPVTDVVSIERTTSSSTVLFMKNALGNILSEHRFDGTKLMLNLSEIPGGVYFLQAADNSILEKLIVE